MMVCTQCGFQNETEDAFCGSCGAFLEWAGEPAGSEESAPAGEAGTGAGAGAAPSEGTAPAPAETARQGPTEADAPAASETVVDVRAEAQAADGDHVAAGPATEAERGKEAAPAAGRASAQTEVRTRGAAVVTGPPAPSPTREQVAPAPTPTAAPAGRPPGRPPGQTPVARRPDDVTPVSQRKRPVPTKPPPRREVRPGDLICGQCQEGNDPDRRFCRRCGESLIEAKEAVAPPPVPWWKRLFIRQPKVVAAGERPMRRGGSGARDLRSRLRQATRVTAVVAAALVAIAYVGPWRSTVNDKVRDVFRGAREKVIPKLNEIPPATVDASSSLPDHKPAAAVDRVTNTYWAEGAPGDGVGQHLVVTFARPIHLGKIGFSLGASTKEGDFATEPRPKEVLLHFFNGSKELTSKKLTLKDSPDFQQYDLNAKSTDKIDIEIVSVNRSPGSRSDCSIAEVEFWERT
jgi:hypothetical protein